MSASVWMASKVEISFENDMSKYLFKDEYLTEANKEFLQSQHRSFLIPTNDLISTEEWRLSPFEKAEEEKDRRNYAQTVTGVVVNRGMPDYMFSVFGLKDLHEEMHTLEKAAALDLNLSQTVKDEDGEVIAPSRNYHPTQMKGALLPYQRSYRLGITDQLWSWDVQGGFAANKQDRLFTSISARWSRFLQANTYFALTSLAQSSFSVFLNKDCFVSTAIGKDVRKNWGTTQGLVSTSGMSYIF